MAQADYVPSPTRTLITGAIPKTSRNPARAVYAEIIDALPQKSLPPIPLSLSERPKKLAEVRYFFGGSDTFIARHEKRREVRPEDLSGGLVSLRAEP